MVIAISGTSCAGKTLLAGELMKRHGIPYFSVDHLMMGIYRSGGDCGYSPESPVRVIASVLWPIVEGMIKTNIENGSSFIYEGFQLRPDDIERMDGDYRKSVLAVYLCLGPGYIKREYASIRGNRHVMEKRSDVEPRDKMLAAADEYLEACGRSGVAPHVIDGDFRESMERILERVGGSIASARDREKKGQAPCRRP